MIPLPSGGERDEGVQRTSAKFAVEISLVPTSAAVTSPGDGGWAVGRLLHPRFISLPPRNWAFETVDFASTEALTSVALHSSAGPGSLISSGFVFARCRTSSRELGSVRPWLPWSWGPSRASPELGHSLGSPVPTGWAIAVLPWYCNGLQAKLACAF